MSLTDEQRERLADVVELQPTKNAELGNRWGMDSGSDVHRYLEDELGEYYYRDDDSMIRATPDAAELVGADPEAGDGQRAGITLTGLEAQVFQTVAGPDERAESVVSVLRGVRDAYGVEPTAEEVRSALQSLRGKNLVEVVRRTVPTFKLAVERDAVAVELSD